MKFGHSIHRPFNYNEDKVKEGVATCIDAGNYPLDHDQMSLNMKIKYLDELNKLNEDANCNSLHVSLNFDPRESDLSDSRLQEIAQVYMQGIGFGKQPYLVYRHFDAGHPHIHIVTTPIQANGKRIETHRLGQLKSEPVRKRIEETYNLVRAEGQKQLQPYELQPISAARVVYGKTQSKRAIQTVLDHVLGKYKFTNLPELNAILKQYNVIADRGTATSRIFQHSGLLYRIIDADQNPVGVPIKASNFYNTPTMAKLSEKFVKNEAERLPYKSRVKSVIDAALRRNPGSLQELVKELERQGIKTDIRSNDDGVIYGLTYVDHKTKCVFNGSALGKKYSAKAIQEMCNPKTRLEAAKKANTADSDSIPQRPEEVTKNFIPSLEFGTIPILPEMSKLVSGMLEPEQPADYQQPHFQRKKRRKKRKNIR